MKDAADILMEMLEQLHRGFIRQLDTCQTDEERAALIAARNRVAQSLSRRRADRAERVARIKATLRPRVVADYCSPDVCARNQQGGDCGSQCEKYLDGGCPIADEIGVG